MRSVKESNFIFWFFRKENNTDVKWLPQEAATKIRQIRVWVQEIYQYPLSFKGMACGSFSMHLLLLQVTAQHHLHDIAVQNNCQVCDVLGKVGDLALPQEPKMFPPGISGLQNNSCLCLLYSVSGLHLPGHSHSFDTVFMMSAERRAEERTYRKRPSS